MKVLREEVVNISDLKMNLFVRQKLDEDRVEYFMDLINSKSEVPLIEITEDLCMVDGRHRCEGYQMCDVNSIRVKVLRFADETEMIAYAFRQNTGGSKPPTTADIEHTTQMLLERGCGVKQIAESLGFPFQMMKKYVQVVKDRLIRAKMQRAAMFVNEGLTIHKAAEKEGVDVEKLKVLLSGRRKRHKTNGVGEMRKMITKISKSVNLKKAHAFQKLMEMFDEGDANESQIRDIIKHCKDLNKLSTQGLDQWGSRFEAKFSEAKLPQRDLKKSA